MIYILILLDSKVLIYLIICEYLFCPNVMLFCHINYSSLVNLASLTNFIRLFLLIVEYNVITCCTIYHVMNIKLFVLFSALLDQLLMFLVHSVNFMLIFSFNELELSLLRLQLHILTCLTIFLTHIQ